MPNYKFKRISKNTELMEMQKQIEDNFLYVDKKGHARIKGTLFCDRVETSEDSLYLGDVKLSAPGISNDDYMLVYNHNKKRFDYEAKPIISQDIITSTTTVSNTTSETAIYTHTISANTLVAEEVIEVKASGILSNATNNDDITITLDMGSTELMSFNPAIGNVSNSIWRFFGEITIRSIGSTGSVAFHGELMIAGYFNYIIDVVTVDTTAAANFVINVQWDNAKAGNTISIYQGFAKILGSK